MDNHFRPQRISPIDDGRQLHLNIVYAFTNNRLLFDASMELIRLLTGIAGVAGDVVIDLSE